MGIFFVDSFDDRFFANGASYAKYHKKWGILPIPRSGIYVSEDSTSNYANSIAQVPGVTDKACQINGNSFLRKGIAGFYDSESVTIGFALKISSGNRNIANILIWRDQAGFYTAAQVSITNELRIQINSPQNLFFLTEQFVTLNEFQYIEITYYPGAVDILTVFRNGIQMTFLVQSVPIDNFIGNDFLFDSVTLFNGDITNGNVFDDVYFATNLGVNSIYPWKVSALVPNANSSLTRTGQNLFSDINFGKVNECYLANYNTDIISAGTSPSFVSYNFQNINATNIRAVQSLSWVTTFKQFPASTYPNIIFTPLVNISSQDYFGTQKNLEVVWVENSEYSWEIASTIWEKNPANDVSWDSATLSNAEFGLRCQNNVSLQSFGYFNAITIEVLGAVTVTPPITTRVFIIS